MYFSSSKNNTHQKNDIQFMAILASFFPRFQKSQKNENKKLELIVMMKEKKSVKEKLFE